MRWRIKDGSRVKRSRASRRRTRGVVALMRKGTRKVRAALPPKPVVVEEEKAQVVIVRSPDCEGIRIRLRGNLDVSYDCRHVDLRYFHGRPGRRPVHQPRYKNVRSGGARDKVVSGA